MFKFIADFIFGKRASDDISYDTLEAAQINWRIFGDYAAGRISGKEAELEFLVEEKMHPDNLWLRFMSASFRRDHSALRVVIDEAKKAGFSRRTVGIWKRAQARIPSC